jgi:hypothetical protein
MFSRMAFFLLDAFLINQYSRLNPLEISYYLEEHTTMHLDEM